LGQRVRQVLPGQRVRSSRVFLAIQVFQGVPWVQRDQSRQEFQAYRVNRVFREGQWVRRGRLIRLIQLGQRGL
jgi:hypothetical protein